MKRTTNIDGAFVCHCARIRHSELLEIFSESSEPSYENFKRQYGIGGQCASCEYEVKAILDEYVGSRGPGFVAAPRHPLQQLFLDRAVEVRRWLTATLPIARPKLAKAEGKINNRACIFFICRPGLQSSLVVSNVNNPESRLNPNRGTVFFRYAIYDGSGELVKRSERLSVRANQTRELFVEELFDRVPEDFVGSIFVEYYDLIATNTLRPYCVLNYSGPDGSLRSRQHYHDKLYSGIIPGFVQCPSVLMPRRECWVAMVNCAAHDFDATLNLRLDGVVRQVHRHFGPYQSDFRSISELFGVSVAETPIDAHFWIESDRYVMTYYFWHALETDVWIGQHH